MARSFLGEPFSFCGRGVQDRFRCARPGLYVFERERFAREVGLAASLQHPNIVPILRAGTAGDLPYYTMPYISGESVRSRVQHAGPLTTLKAISILHGVGGCAACRGDYTNLAAGRGTDVRRCSRELEICQNCARVWPGSSRPHISIRRAAGAVGSWAAPFDTQPSPSRPTRVGLRSIPHCHIA